MSSAQLPLFHQREALGPERRRIRAVRAAGPGPAPRLQPLPTHSREASAGQGRVPGEHGPPATLSGRGWRAVLPLLGTTLTQPQVTAQLAQAPWGECVTPPRGEADLTSFLHHVGGQQGDLLPLVGQETEARSSSQQTQMKSCYGRAILGPAWGGQGRGGVAGKWSGQGRGRDRGAWPGQE